MRLVFLGPPASGKGTLSELIARELDVIPVSTGVMLRQAMADETPFGVKVRPYMEQSRLVPDELVCGMVAEWLERHRDSGWILDGFPRTVAQAEILSKTLADLDLEFDGAVNLEVSKEALLERITLRVQCGDCGMTTARSAVENFPVCPKCGGTLSARLDDQADRFELRYQDFLEHTAPVIDYYAGRGELISVNAETGPDELAEALVSQLKQVS